MIRGASWVQASRVAAVRGVIMRVMALHGARSVRAFPAIARTGELLPRGGLLPEDVWVRRHKAIVVLLAAHAVVIAALVVPQGFEPLHALTEGSVVAVAAVAATLGRFSRRVRAMIATFGLLSASAILVHLSGGYIELHFHFFVMIIVISLYQDWWPFLLAIGYVVLHHGVIGVVDPASVYNHPDAVANPWLWAAVHGAFILAASVASMVAWRLNEDLIRERVRSQEEVAARLRTLLESEAAARAAADRATLARDVFFTRASHELRTPLNAITGFSELLRERSTALSDRERRYVERVHAAGQSLVTLLDQVLALAELESGRPLVLERINATALARALCEPARAACDAAQVGFEEVLASGDLIVSGDASRLRVALAELLRIAIEMARQGGKLRLETRAHQSAEEREPGRFAIEITTSGVADEDEDLAHLFEPFPMQFDRGASEARSSRLGHAFAKKVIELHGGSVVAERTSNGSTILRVMLPMARTDEGSPTARTLLPEG